LIAYFACRRSVKSKSAIFLRAIAYAATYCFCERIFARERALGKPQRANAAMLADVFSIFRGESATSTRK
jgi:hypothetical protein